MSEAALTGLLDWVKQVGPTLLAAVAIAIVGFVVAAIARRVTAWAVRKTGLEVLAERVGAPRWLYAVGIKRSVPDTLGQVVWLVTLLVTVSAVFEKLGLRGVADGVSTLVGFVPQLITGALIALAGIYAAEVARNLVARVSAKRMDPETADLLGRAAQGLIIATALTMAADQIGLPTQLINATLLLSIGAVAAGIALAFALGARGVVEHLVARHYLQRMYRPGDRLELSDRSGELVRFGAVSAVLKTDDGELVIPCAALLEGTVGLVRKPDSL